MTIVVIRDMVDPTTKKVFQRVLVATLDSIADLPNLLQAIEDRFPREQSRHG
jgi:hypothetical protein